MFHPMHSVSATFIHHFILERPHSVLSLLREEMDCSEDTAEALVALGAVYLNMKRIREDATLIPSDYVRVHSNPKRYPVSQIDWKARIVFQNEDFIVVNKPPGVPVPSSVDNDLENLCYQLTQFLGLPLYVTHRLDIPVQGLVVLAKTKEFQTRFNKLLINRRVIKKYRALVSHPVSLGNKIHYMKKSKRAPKQLSTSPEPDHLECILEVLESSEFRLNEKIYHLIELRLETGRTHQIRAQLSALDAPILGDELYGSKDSFLSAQAENSIALQACDLEYEQFQFTLPFPWGAQMEWDKISDRIPSHPNASPNLS